MKKIVRDEKLNIFNECFEDMAIMTYTRAARCGDCKFCERYYKRKKDGNLYKYCYYKCEKTGEVVTYMTPVCKEWELL